MSPRLNELLQALARKGDQGTIVDYSNNDFKRKPNFLLKRVLLVMSLASGISFQTGRPGNQNLALTAEMGGNIYNRQTKHSKVYAINSVQKNCANN
jgi:hypothetical protein